MKASGQITASAFCTFPDKIDALRQQARGVKATPLPVGKVMTWCATGPKLLMPAQLELGGCLQQHMHALSVSGGWWSGDTPDCFCPRWPDGWMDGPQPSPELCWGRSSSRQKAAGLVWTLLCSVVFLKRLKWSCVAASLTEPGLASLSFSLGCLGTGSCFREKVFFSLSQRHCALATSFDNHT